MPTYVGGDAGAIVLAYEGMETFFAHAGTFLTRSFIGQVVAFCLAVTLAVLIWRWIAAAFGAGDR